ncbi:MAG TPA: PH domain-containing protein [Tepidisphaeraceae bacterium]|jgi:hypothetical protein
MGLLDKVLGNASLIDSKKLQDEIGPLLIAGEVIESGFVVWRDVFAFTNKRLILVDRQGLTGKKIEYLCIPYYSVESFAVETAGHFDRDAELKIWVRGIGLIKKEIKKDIDLMALTRTLSSHIL